jgi:hypothetical protein
MSVHRHQVLELTRLDPKATYQTPEWQHFHLFILCSGHPSTFWPCLLIHKYTSVYTSFAKNNADTVWNIKGFSSWYFVDIYSIIWIYRWYSALNKHYIGHESSGQCVLRWIIPLVVCACFTNSGTSLIYNLIWPRPWVRQLQFMSVTINENIFQVELHSSYYPIVCILLFKYQNVFP